MTELTATLLDHFRGYLELGMYGEANDELENLPAEVQAHPAVQLARLELLIEMRNWPEGVTLAASLCAQWPDANEFFFRRAYCLHELKRTSEAKDILLQGPMALRQQAVFFYNLACYEAQLGSINEAKQQLQICFQMDKAFKAEALGDPDLVPVWDSVAT